MHTQKTTSQPFFRTLYNVFKDRGFVNVYQGGAVNFVRSLLSWGKCATLTFYHTIPYHFAAIHLCTGGLGIH